MIFLRKPFLSSTLFSAIIFVSCASNDKKLDSKQPGFNDDRVKSIVIDITEVLNLDFKATPVVGSKEILEVQPQGASQQFRVRGLKIGSSSLVFLKDDGQIARRMMFNVMSDEMANAVVNVRSMLRGIEGVTVKAVDEKVVIEGELMEPRAFDKILAVKEAYGNNLILNLATINKQVYENAALKMQEEIRQSPRGADISVKFINGTYILDGEVNDYNDRTRAESIAQAYMPETMGSAAVRAGLIVQGGSKVSIRNVIVVRKKSSK